MITCGSKSNDFGKQTKISLSTQDQLSLGLTVVETSGRIGSPMGLMTEYAMIPLPREHDS